MVGAGKVGTTSEALGEVGIVLDNGREILCGGGTRGAYVWVIDVEGLQGFPPPSGTADGGHVPQTFLGWEMGVPTHWKRAGNSGMDEIGVYFTLRHNNVAQYITTRPIMNLCLAVKRKIGLRISRIWREQSTLYILGIRTGHAAVEIIVQPPV